MYQDSYTLLYLLYYTVILYTICNYIIYSIYCILYDVYIYMYSVYNVPYLNTTDLMMGYGQHNSGFISMKYFKSQPKTSRGQRLPSSFWYFQKYFLKWTIKAFKEVEKKNLGSNYYSHASSRARCMKFVGHKWPPGQEFATTGLNLRII